MSCSSQTFTSRNCENLKNHDSTTVRPIPFATGGDEVFIVVGSLDGLVCVALERTCELVIWNPLTTAYKKLSMSNAPPFFRRNRDAIGFYFDSSNNDYKLLQVVSNDPSVCLVVVKGCIHLCVAYGKFTDTDKPFLADSKGELWRMDDGDCWTKVAVFFRAQHSPLRFNNFYVSRNGNSIVILDHNNLLYKLDMEDLATNFYVNFYIWHPDYKHSIYSETLVSPNP
ncbi:hypothetical protein Tco_0015176 [Tanacetum coccineum]